MCISVLNEIIIFIVHICLRNTSNIVLCDNIFTSSFAHTTFYWNKIRKRLWRKVIYTIACYFSIFTYSNKPTTASNKKNYYRKIGYLHSHKTIQITLRRNNNFVSHRNCLLCINLTAFNFSLKFIFGNNIYTI